MDGHLPHRSPAFADSRPMARSLARSTARAALRLLSSLRRFLFDLVMVASLRQLRSYSEASPHCSPPSLPPKFAIDELSEPSQLSQG